MSFSVKSYKTPTGETSAQTVFFLTRHIMRNSGDWPMGCENFVNPTNHNASTAHAQNRVMTKLRFFAKILPPRDQDKKNRASSLHAVIIRLQNDPKIKFLPVLGRSVPFLQSTCRVKKKPSNKFYNNFSF